MENKITKKKPQGRGRRRTELKKIEKQSALQVSFCKRKRGLFRKASEFALQCGAELAILLESPAGKNIYAFEQPSVEDLINRVSASPAPLQVNRRSDYGRSKYEYDEAVRSLLAEEGRMASGGRWWEDSVDGLGLQELKNYLTALEGLRGNVLGEIQKKETINSSAAPAPAPAPAPALSIQDFGCVASTPTYADQDFDFASVDQDFDFASSTVDQDFDFCASSPSYADQKDFSGFYDSTTS